MPSPEIRESESSVEKRKPVDGLIRKNRSLFRQLGLGIAIGTLALMVGGRTAGTIDDYDNKPKIESGDTGSGELPKGEIPLPEGGSNILRVARRKADDEGRVSEYEIVETGQEVKEEQFPEDEMAA